MGFVVACPSWHIVVATVEITEIEPERACVRHRRRKRALLPNRTISSAMRRRGISSTGRAWTRFSPESSPGLGPVDQPHRHTKPGHFEHCGRAGLVGAEDQHGIGYVSLRSRLVPLGPRLTSQRRCGPYRQPVGLLAQPTSIRSAVVSWLEGLHPNGAGLIPSPTDHDAWAHFRRPMDMMRQG